MKILHRYLISEFLKMFLMSLLLLCLLFMVSEFFFRLDEFVKYHASFKFVLKYMSVLPPMWLRDVMPMAIFASVIFSLNKFSRNGEITAIKACGISMYGFLMPVIIFAPAAALFSLWLNMQIVPDSFVNSKVMREQTLRGEVKQSTRIYSNLTFADSSGRSYVIDSYDPSKMAMTGVNIYRGVKEWIIAERTVYKDGRWIMYNVLRRLYSADGKDILSEKKYPEIYPDIKEKPEDFIPAAGEPEEMNTPKLAEYISKLRKFNMPYAKELVAYHLRFSYPFANVIVVFLGIPFALGLTGRYERIKGTGYILVFSFLYWVLVSTGTVIGGAGTFCSPLAGAWLANVIFAAVGGVLFAKIQK